MSGALEDLLVAVGENKAACCRPRLKTCLSLTFFLFYFLFGLVKCVKNAPAYLAERIFKSMKVNDTSVCHEPDKATHCFVASRPF